jgi:hypothetical protein
MSPWVPLQNFMGDSVGNFMENGIDYLIALVKIELNNRTGKFDNPLFMLAKAKGVLCPAPSEKIFKVHNGNDAFNAVLVNINRDEFYMVGKIIIIPTPLLGGS